MAIVKCWVAIFGTTARLLTVDTPLTIKIYTSIYRTQGEEAPSLKNRLQTCQNFTKDYKKPDRLVDIRQNSVSFTV